MAKSIPKSSSKPAKSTKVAKPAPAGLGALPAKASEIWSAGLGALGDAQKQGGARFDDLVERGRSLRDTGTNAVQDVIARAESAASGAVETVKETGGGVAEAVASRFEHAVEAVLATVGFPKRDEVDALRAQVDALQARLEHLLHDATDHPAPARTESERTVYEVATHDAGWQVRAVGADRATSVHPTKKEALRAGRQRARAAAPSRLLTYKTDGSLGDAVEYEA